MDKGRLWLKALSAWFRRHRHFLFAGATVWFAVNVFVIWFVKTEKTVYYWDNSAYWTGAIALLHQFQVSFSTGWKAFSESFSTDYNYLPIAPFLPFMEIFGVGRVKFILLITNLYLLPATLLYTLVLLRVIKHQRVLTFGLIFALASFFPPLLRPVLSGQVDAVGLLVIAIIAWLCSRVDFLRISKQSISLGFLLCLLIVLRRWYSFWVLSAGVAFVAAYWSLQPRNIKRLLPLGINLAIAAIITLGTLILAFPYLFRAYLLDYNDLYSAYMIGGALSNLERLIYYFGTIVIVLAAIGVGSAMRGVQGRVLQGVSVFALTQTILAYVLFTRTQSFSAHHYYLLVPFFLVGMAALVTMAIERFKARPIVLHGSMAGLIITLLVSAFVIKIPGETQGVFLGESSPPVVRKDLPTMKRLVEYLDKVRRPDESVYILASSDVFNDSLFRDVPLPAGYVDNVLASSHVDKRDGFPNVLFTAKYVIVADPIQTHLPSGQLVVTQVAKDILNGEVHNLEKVRSFTIDDGVSLNVYKKLGPYDEGYIRHLRDVFEAAYPDYKNLTNIYQ